MTIFGLAFVAALEVACAATPGLKPAEVKSAPPASAPAPVVSAPQASLPATEAAEAADNVPFPETPQQIVDRACQACHNLSVLSQKPHAAAEWPGIVQRMRSGGADLTDDEAKLVQAYLAEKYSAKP